MMKSYGLIGNPIIHSLSPLLFQKQFGDTYTYNLFPLENVEDIRLWIHQHPDLMGINITKPFKESVLPYLDELSPEAKHIGAVNVIEIQRRSENMVLKGHNTDFYGFQKSLQAFVKGLISSALILGTGGAAKAFDLNLLLLSERIPKVQFKFIFDLRFLFVAGILLLLSYIFQYGEQLQQLSDETI